MVRIEVFHNPRLYQTSIVMLVVFLLRWSKWISDMGDIGHDALERVQMQRIAGRRGPHAGASQPLEDSSHTRHPTQPLPVQ
jgi:hypothetical protein